MRVLHVLSSLNIGSGIANSIMSNYREIASNGAQFDFLLFCTMEKDFSKEVEELGGQVYYISKPNGINFLDYNKKVRDFFKQHKGKWDIVHIHEILVQKFIIKGARKYGKVKKIITHSHARDFVLPNYGMSKLKNKITMAMKRIRNKILLQGIKENSDYYFACSNEAGKALFGKKILENSKFYVIKNAINVDNYLFNSETREKYKTEFSLTDKKVIILVGRLCVEKNQLFFLEVMKKIIEVDKDFVLLLVGDGKLKSSIEKNIEEMGLNDYVILTGNRNDLANIFQCADLSVMPSLAEGLGIALIEAQSAGLPCLASTGVPSEAQVTPYVKFIDLQEGAQNWADTILGMQLERYDTQEYIRESGYSIKESALNLLTIYQNMVREEI